MQHFSLKQPRAVVARGNAQLLVPVVKHLRDSGADAPFDHRVTHRRPCPIRAEKQVRLVTNTVGQRDRAFMRLDRVDLDVEEQTRRYREVYWDEFDFTDARLLRTPVFHNKLDRYINKLTSRNVEAVIESVDKLMAGVKANDELFSYVTSYLCLSYEKSKLMGGESIYVHVIDKYLTNELAVSVPRKELQKLRQRANKLRPSLLGKTAQDIKCIDPDGSDLALYDLKAPIVALYMYFVDCEHCQEATPELHDIYLDWKDRGLEVYALCLDIDVDPWFDYIDKENLTWHNAIDPRYESRPHLKYNVDITPELYVLDANHKIIGLNLKPSQLEEWFLEKKLAARPAEP